MGFYNVTEVCYPAQGFTEYRLFSHGVKTDFQRVRKKDELEEDSTEEYESLEDLEWAKLMKHERSVR